VYWQDSHYWDVNVATKLYHFEVLGKRLGEPELKIWGSGRDVTLETSDAKARPSAGSTTAASRSATGSARPRCGRSSRR
jgi:hypothetical protein